MVSHSQLSAQDGFRFWSGVELVNVTVTVTDRTGRFVPDLRQTDFVVHDDDQPVEVTQLDDPDDEMFLYGFASNVRLIQDWTNDGQRVSAGLRRVDAVGGTALYDAVFEVVRNARDLTPATTSIADELSRQDSLGYTSPGNRDGRWHSIGVDVRDRSLQVRARRGYTAS